MKAYSGNVVATSFLYLMVYRGIAGDVPIYIKFALKVTHPFQKRRFRQISLNSASAVRVSKKVQLSLIGSRQCAFHRAINEPFALSISPQRLAQNENFYIWHCLLLSLLQVIADTSNLVCGLNISSPILQMTNRHGNVPYVFYWRGHWKGHGHCHVTSLTFGK